MAKVIALLTDFGLDDPYVGQLRGTLLRQAPGATILDISHGIRPHDILQAAFFLAASLPHLPQEAVCLAVVDPGVGTFRRIVCLEQDHRLILAPDNGLLSLTLERPLPTEAWDLTPAHAPAHTSSTFHGRDLFAPLAARLATGSLPSACGVAVDVATLQRLPALSPIHKGNRLTATVLHVDRFGNCILNLTVAQWVHRLLRSGSLGMVEPQHTRITTVSAYAELPSKGLGLLAGSQGYLELAMDRQSAAATLGLRPGEKCVFELPG